MRIPSAVDAIAADRSGSDVYVTLKIPTQNIDTSRPADVAHIDVYAVTATTPPARTQFLAQASRVAVVPVAPEQSDDSVPQPNPVPAGAPVQGSSITVRDVLKPEQLVPPPPLPAPRGSRPTPAPVVPDARGVSVGRDPLAVSAVAAGPPLPRRFYMAIPFSRRGRPGPPGAIAEVPLMWLPEPPPVVQVTPQGEELSVNWEPSGDVLGFVLDAPLPIEPPPFEDVTVPESKPLASDVPSGPTRYNVYRVDSDSGASSTLAWAAARPTPLNEQPLDTLTFTAPAEFGRKQCYTVRAVRGAPGATVEGEPSPQQCVTPIDTVPPVAPGNLTAIASEGSISLIWDPNTEIDPGGYLVLRGEAGSATLQTLTAEPIPEPRYTDRTVMAGKTYDYAVIAVDDRKPEPNRSQPSARATETAR